MEWCRGAGEICFGIFPSDKKYLVHRDIHGIRGGKPRGPVNGEGNVNPYDSTIHTAVHTNTKRFPENVGAVL